MARRPRETEHGPEVWAPGDSRAVASIAVQFFVNGAVIASYVPRLPGIRDRLDTTLGTIGLVIAVATLGGVVGSAFVGRLVARFGTKSVMLTGAVGIVLLLPLVAWSQAPWQLLIVLAALSVFDVLTDVAMNIQGSRLSAKRRVPVMNRLHGMWSIGTVVGGAIAAAMAALDIGLRTHLTGAAIVLLLALLYVAPGLLSVDTPPPDDATTGGQGPARSILLFGLLGAAAIVPEMVNSDWAAFRLTDDLGASEGVAGMGYVAFTSGMVVGRLAGDSVVARMGGSLVLRWATIVGIAGTAAATLIPWTPSVFIGVFVAGCGISVMFPQLYDSAARAKRSGEALGALTAGSRVSLFVAPAAVGLIADTDTFSVGNAIALMVIPTAVAVLVLARGAPASKATVKASEASPG